MIKAVPEFKVILIGDSGVGKSCLLLRFADGHFLADFKYIDEPLHREFSLLQYSKFIRKSGREKRR